MANQLLYSGTFIPVFAFLRLSVFVLGTCMEQTDRQTNRRAKHII